MICEYNISEIVFVEEINEVVCVYDVRQNQVLKIVNFA